MKNMNYQQAAAEAVKEFDECRKSCIVKEIEKSAQFRKLTVYESSGITDNLKYCLFGLEFCDKNGKNYREIMIAINFIDGQILRDARLYTITNI